MRFTSCIPWKILYLASICCVCGLSTNMPMIILPLYFNWKLAHVRRIWLANIHWAYMYTVYITTFQVFWLFDYGRIQSVLAIVELEQVCEFNRPGKYKWIWNETMCLTSSFSEYSQPISNDAQMCTHTHTCTDSRTCMGADRMHTHYKHSSCVNKHSS